MIKGSGNLITLDDDQGEYIPFLTTEEILKQLYKFGFYIQYDVKSNLPNETLDFLQQVLNLGYDKITRVMLQTTNKDGDTIWANSIVVYKSCPDNVDLLSYGQKLSRIKYIKKVDNNTILNVTHEGDNGIDWDWVTSFYNISEIIDENLDAEDYVTDTNVEPEDSYPIQEVSSEDVNPYGYTPYDNSDDEADFNESEDDNDGLE